METMTNEEQHLLKFMKQIAKEQKFDNFDLKVTPISSGGANFTSKLYRVKISGKGRDDLDLFAKAAVMSEKMRNQSPINSYENEQLVYTNLFQSYRYLEEKHGVPEENRLKFPKYYGADMTHMQEIMVLEDLTSKGFNSVNRFESVDWQYAAAAVSQLAKFHALSIAYQHENPSDFDKLIKRLPEGFLPETEDSSFIINRFISSALAAVREENKEKLNTFLKGLDVAKAYNNMLKALKRKVLIHLDYRPNNILYRVKNDGTMEVTPLDFQTVQVGSPVIDLMFFIFTSTDGMFRAKYYQELVSYYYSELSAALARLGLDVEEKYSKEDFEFEMKQKQSLGLLLAVTMLPLLTAAEDQAPSMDDTVEITSLAVETTSDLFSKRLNEIVDECVEWGVL